MLKVRRTTNGEVIYSVSGRLEPDSLRELSAALTLEVAGPRIALDLQELVLVDRAAVAFLRTCERKGIMLRNCPNYVRLWMACDRQGSK